MKNFFKSAILFAYAAFLMVGCKKDENRVVFLGGTPPVITASKTNVVLTPTTATQEALRLTWTNPNYRFNTGVSSHDVQYSIEMDVNTNFNSPRKFVTTVAKDLTTAFTVDRLNSILGNQMGVEFDREVTIFVRVISSLRFEGAVNGQLISNVISFRTTPFAPPPLVEVPANNELWVVGDATDMGWNIGIPDPFRTTLKFQRVSNTLYRGEFNFRGGGFFKLIQDVGVWGTQYHRVEGTWDKGTFEKADADPAFLGPPAAGRYRMTVNFQNGTYTMEKI
jgi:hypothetical protein